VGLDLAGDAHGIAEAGDGAGVALLAQWREPGAGEAVGRHRLHEEAHLFGRVPEPGVVIAAAPRGVLDTPGSGEPVGGLVEEDLEHGGRGKVEGLAGEEHLAPDLPVGHPTAAPPVSELDEAAALDSAAEDDHRRG
jgi:hypothetical protein